MKIEEKVYKKLLQVPSGKITTYGELSRLVGLKNGQRIIGHIMKKNPFPVIVPCHRVIKSNGSIGGYTFGIERKKNMLKKEGIHIKKNKIVNFEKTLYKF